MSTVRWDPKGMRRSTGLESMGAVAKMNRSAKEEARSSLHYGGEGELVHSSYQGVCGRHGAADSWVTSGELAEVLGGAGKAIL